MSHTIPDSSATLTNICINNKKYLHSSVCGQQSPEKEKHDLIHNMHLLKVQQNKITEVKTSI